MLYDEAKVYIENEIAKYHLKSKVALPKVTIDKTGNRISIKFPVQTNADLFALLNVFVKGFGEMKVDTQKTLPNSVFLWGDNKAVFFFADPNKVVDVVKMNELLPEEISTILDIYKLGNPIKAELSPLEKLAELGVIVHQPSKSFGWDYLAGYETVKQDIRETIMLPLQHPDVYVDIVQHTRKTIETNRPKAVLFEGPSGTGKTTAARIIANEVDIPLVYIPLETIVSKWYGESEKNLAQIFNTCRETGDCLVFLDEIDALAASRENGIHEASRRVLSVLLREIDGFVPNDKTILIAATNRKNDLDAALLNRFDLSIFFHLPNETERAAIFGNYAKQLAKHELEVLAKGSDSLSGRNIRDVCKYAERKWAAHLIQQHTSVQSPTLAEYLAALKTKGDRYDIKKHIL